MAEPQRHPTSEETARETGERPSLLRGFLVSTVLVIATLVFSLGINLGSFRQNYANTLMAAFSVVGDKAVGNIQEALGYGKPLDDFYGMEPILRQIITSLPWVESVQVALADGRIVQTNDGHVVQSDNGQAVQTGSDRAERTMKESIRRRATAELAKRPYWFDYDPAAGHYALHVPIRNPDDRSLAGFLIIVSAGEAIDSRVQDFRDHIVPPLLWTGLGTIAVLGLFAAASALVARQSVTRESIGRKSGGRRSPRLERAHRALTLGALVAVQIAAGALSYSLLSKAHLEAAEQATDIVAGMVRNDIEAVIRRGSTYGSLHGIDAYFDRILSEMPTLRSIDLRTDAGRADPQRASGLPFASLQDVTLHWPLTADRSGAAPDLVVVVAGDGVARQLTEFGLDMATILITSLLFMFELHRALGSRHAPEHRTTRIPVEGIAISVRFTTFLMYFGAFLPVSFVPLVMATFEQELFGLPPVKAAAAPLTAEMLCGVVAAVAAGHLAGRFGWRPVAMAGFAASAAGMALAAMTGDPLVFVLARGLSGAGTMFGLIGINSLIGRLRGRMDTPALQAGMFAGMYAGVNCGAVSGALLAASNGPTMVFAAGAAIPLLGFLYAAFGVPLMSYWPAATARPATVEAAAERRAGRRWGVAGFLLLISLPTAAAAMFQPFYLPLFVSDLGLSSATVGRAYLMHGLCVVLIGPLLTRLTARRIPIPAGTILSGSLIAAALAMFGMQSSLWTAFATVFLIGVAESFGLAAQIRHVETLAASEASRREATLALHVNARKAGQAVGPMLFGTIAAAGPGGVGMIGAGLAGSLLLFAVLMRQWRTEPERAPS